jgi:hypothetical protein
MQTPEKIAKELFEKHLSLCKIAIAGAYTIWPPLAKNLAKLTVNEIINEVDMGYYFFWDEVKKEIDKL